MATEHEVLDKLIIEEELKKERWKLEQKGSAKEEIDKLNQAIIAARKDVGEAYSKYKEVTPENELREATYFMDLAKKRVGSKYYSEMGSDYFSKTARFTKENIIDEFLVSLFVVGFLFFAAMVLHSIFTLTLPWTKWSGFLYIDYLWFSYFTLCIVFVVFRLSKSQEDIDKKEQEKTKAQIEENRLAKLVVKYERTVKSNGDIVFTPETNMDDYNGDLLEVKKVIIPNNKESQEVTVGNSSIKHWGWLIEKIQYDSSNHTGVIVDNDDKKPISYKIPHISIEDFNLLRKDLKNKRKVYKEFLDSLPDYDEDDYSYSSSSSDSVTNTTALSSESSVNTSTSSSNKKDKYLGTYDYYYKVKTSSGIEEFNTNYTIEYTDDGYRGTMKVIDENGNTLPNYNDSFSTIQGIIEKDLKNKGMTSFRYNKL